MAATMSLHSSRLLMVIWPLLLFLTPNNCHTSICGVYDNYLTVYMGKSWTLEFSEHQFNKFQKCICSSSTKSSCNISIALLSSRCNRYFVNGIKESTKPTNISFQGKPRINTSVFDCWPHPADPYNIFPCYRKLANKSVCANTLAASSGFHYFPPKNASCRDCSTICWITYSNVTYKGPSGIIKPANGKCNEIANETSSVSGVNTDLTTQYTSSTTSNVSSTTVSTTDSSNSTTSLTSEGMLSNSISTAKHTHSTTIYITKKISTTTHPFTTENNTVPLDSSQQNAGLNSSGQDSQALGIGVGFSCAVLAVVAIVAVLVFYRRRRFKEKQKAEERRISYIQPHGTDCIGADDAGDRDKGSLPVTFNNSSYDCSKYNYDYQLYSALENTYSSIPDEDFSVSNGDLDKNTKRTPAYELAKNATPLREKILRQNIIKESEKEEDVDEVDNPYMELSNESTDSGIALPDYSLATTASIDVEKKQIPNNHVYNKLNGKTKRVQDGFTECLETYNVKADGVKKPNSHVYNRLNGRKDTIGNNMEEELETYNVAAEPKPIMEKETKSILNDENKHLRSNYVNAKTIYNAASEGTEDKESHVYTTLDDDAKPPGLETSNGKDKTTNDQQNHVYNKLNAKTENPDLETYNVASDESATQQSHLYNRLRENTETPTLDTYNMASPKNVQPKNVYNRLNDNAKQNDFKTYNKALGDTVENENQQSNIYDRVKDPRAKSTPGTYSLAAGVKSDQHQQIKNKLNIPDETLDRKTYHTASAVDDQLKSIDQRVKDETKTYDLAGENENKETSPYNRLHGEALTPDLDSYNTASDVENGQRTVYNRLNEKADMPGLGTYNLASEKPKAQPNHTYNKLNGEPLEPDLGTYNKASGELYKTSFDFSQTLDNENDDSEDSNVDYFTLEQE